MFKQSYKDIDVVKLVFDPAPKDLEFGRIITECLERIGYFCINKENKGKITSEIYVTQGRRNKIVFSYSSSVLPKGGWSLLDCELIFFGFSSEVQLRGSDLGGLVKKLMDKDSEAKLLKGKF